METDQYLEVFIDESIEHLEGLTNHLLILETAPNNEEVIDEIFRAAHTIKGMSATMGFQTIADLTHHLENILDAIRAKEIRVNAQIIDQLFQAIDVLNEMVHDIANGGDGEKEINPLLEELNAIYSGEASDPTIAQSMEEPAAKNIFPKLEAFEKTIIQESLEQGFHNYAIEVTLKEDSLLKGVRAFMVFEALEEFGEVIKSEPSVSDLEEEKFDQSFSVLLVSKHQQEEIEKRIYQISEIDNVLIQEHQQASIDQTKEREKQSQGKDEKQQADKSQNDFLTSISQTPMRQTIRVNIERLDVLMNLMEELVIDRGRLEQLADDLDSNELKETVEHLARISTDLQNVMLTMRMVPIRTVFNRFPGMVRQLSREIGKKINFEIIGADTELDRTVIDEIGDPLVHLIRNAIDHGIETPEEREKSGKSKEGFIRLEAYQSGNFIFIEIEDDGSGIDQESVLKRAIERGMIQPNQAETLTDEQIYELIMESGFSTTEEVSDLSGRGVGLDVVKNTIEKLGGNISIQSTPKKGTTFSIQLPLTLSIMSVLLVRLKEEKYAIPLSAIIETIRISKEDIIDVHKNEMIDFRGKMVSLIYLSDYLSVPGEERDPEYLSVVVIQRGEHMVGLVVDGLIQQEEIVIKPLGNYLAEVPAISGATILGDGEVALIIDTNTLVKG